MSNKEKEEKTNQQPASRLYMIYFPTPHGRVGASSKLMLAWGYNDWAAETISRKYNVKITKRTLTRHGLPDMDSYTLEMPEFYDGAAFLTKLFKLYRITATKC